MKEKEERKRKQTREFFVRMFTDVDEEFDGARNDLGISVFDDLREVWGGNLQDSGEGESTDLAIVVPV